MPMMVPPKPTGPTKVRRSAAKRLVVEARAALIAKHTCLLASAGAAEAEGVQQLAAARLRVADEQAASAAVRKSKKQKRADDRGAAADDAPDVTSPTPTPTKTRRRESDAPRTPDADRDGVVGDDGDAADVSPFEVLDSEGEENDEDPWVEAADADVFERVDLGAEDADPGNKDVADEAIEDVPLDEGDADDDDGEWA